MPDREHHWFPLGMSCPLLLGSCLAPASNPWGRLDFVPFPLVLLSKGVCKSLWSHHLLALHPAKPQIPCLACFYLHVCEHTHPPLAL